ncbi:hypothetical protein HYW58_01665 [Candidatus Kaiserbacteria bacterium]|nr:hypothetical protein [Candidatus Kaiserbacteria bacterium]
MEMAGIEEVEFVLNRHYVFTRPVLTYEPFNPRTGKERQLFFQEGHCFRRDIKRDGFWFIGKPIPDIGKREDGYAFFIKRQRITTIDKVFFGSQCFRIIEGGKRAEKHKFADISTL